jgi:ribosomal protein S18 acetylase RimI-like enzyme
LIRPATTSDAAALAAIEHASFAGDRVSRRSWRHLLGRASALTLLDEQDGALRGYIMLLFRAGLSVARVYTIATHPDFLGQGVAAALLLRAEQAALAHRRQANPCNGFSPAFSSPRDTAASSRHSPRRRRGRRARGRS